MIGYAYADFAIKIVSVKAFSKFNGLLTPCADFAIKNLQVRLPLDSAQK
jgi:hypothetical protein